MKLTFFGQNSFHIAINDIDIIVDPFISGNSLSKDKVDIKTLKADFILLTHAHQDHVLDAEAIAKNTGATIVSNYEIANYYEAKELKVHPMNHGGKWQFPFGELKYVNAIHTSSFEDGTYGGQPGGFILKTKEKTVYIAGDTALTMDMKLIPMSYKLDLAILPIGDNFTMGVDDAVIASDFVDCNRILGCHYDTFGFIEIDKEKAQTTFSDKGKELILLGINETLEV